MGDVKVESHYMGSSFSQLTSLSFHVNWPSYSWDRVISKTDVENSRSRSWVMSKLKVTTWVHRSVDSHPFRFMSIGQPFLSYDLSKFDLEIQGAMTWLGVTVQSRKVGLTHYQHTSLSFHVSWSSHSWDTAVSKFDLKNPGYGQMTMMLHNYRSRQFHKTSNGRNPSNGYRYMDGFCNVCPKCCMIWKVFSPWASPYWANGQMTKTMHNYRPRQFQRTSNGENSSSITDIWVPQVWQPIPLQHGGLRGKGHVYDIAYIYTYIHTHIYICIYIHGPKMSQKAQPNWLIFVQSDFIGWLAQREPGKVIRYYLRECTEWHDNCQSVYLSCQLGT